MPARPLGERRSNDAEQSQLGFRAASLVGRAEPAAALRCVAAPVLKAPPKRGEP